MHLSEINIYPVKSLRGLGVESATVDRRGFEFDRRWMLVDEKGRFVSQREIPKMARIAVSIADGELRFEIDGKFVAGSFEPVGAEELDVMIWNDRCRANVYPDSINGWISEALGADCRLVKLKNGFRRAVDADYAVREDDHVSFADGFPYLLIGEGSLADLNSRLEPPVPMNRFRPNLVVAGAGAFDEDSWKRIRIGESVFHVVKACSRCVITSIDQATGEKSISEPLKALAKYRTIIRNGAQKIVFGQNLIADAVGQIVRVGDEVEIIEYR
jgi:uncharacterized protein YcbX